MNSLALQGYFYCKYDYYHTHNACARAKTHALTHLN